VGRDLHEVLCTEGGVKGINFGEIWEKGKEEQSLRKGGMSAAVS
jgi:hypothetical protein